MIIAENQRLKEKIVAEIGEYYGSTEEKTLDNGTKIYMILPRPGFRMLPLGYFPSEELALMSFRDYLKDRKLI